MAAAIDLLVKGNLRCFLTDDSSVQYLISARGICCQMCQLLPRMLLFIGIKHHAFVLTVCAGGG